MKKPKPCYGVLHFDETHVWKQEKYVENLSRRSMI